MALTHRRAFLRGSAAAAAGTAVAVAGGRAATAGERNHGPTPDRPTTFVLVHTGYASSAWWTGVAAELTLRGHRAVAVDLPGHGPDAYYPKAYQAPQDMDGLRTESSPGAAITVDDYAEEVTASVLRASANGPVVLVGHGDAGAAAITRAGNALSAKIRHIVYVDAYLCVEMRTIGEYLSTPENDEALLAPVVQTAPELGVARCNWRSADAGDLAACRAALGQDFTDSQLRAMLNSLSPDVGVTLWGADIGVDAATWGRIPRTYVRFTADRTIPVALQDRMIAEADRLTPENRFAVHDVPAPHAGPLHHPAIVRTLLNLG